MLRLKMPNALTHSERVTSLPGLKPCYKSRVLLPSGRGAARAQPQEPSPAMTGSLAQPARHPALISGLPVWGLLISRCLAKQPKGNGALVPANST